MVFLVHFHHLVTSTTFLFEFIWTLSLHCHSALFIPCACHVIMVCSTCICLYWMLTLFLPWKTCQWWIIHCSILLPFPFSHLVSLYIDLFSVKGKMWLESFCFAPVLVLHGLIFYEEHFPVMLHLQSPVYLFETAIYLFCESDFRMDQRFLIQHLSMGHIEKFLNGEIF